MGLFSLPYQHIFRGAVLWMHDTESNPLMVDE